MINAATAAIIAHVAFWALLVLGWFRHELGSRGIVMALVIWSAVHFGLARLQPYAVVPALALVDIVLVLVIFKGDVRF